VSSRCLVFDACVFALPSAPPPFFPPILFVYV
jgi:hypothetical protein